MNNTEPTEIIQELRNEVQRIKDEMKRNNDTLTGSLEELVLYVVKILDRIDDSQTNDKAIKKFSKLSENFKLSNPVKKGDL